MKKYGTLSDQMATRIQRKKALVFRRADFADLGGYAQVGGFCARFVGQGKLVKIGYGLYAKAKTLGLIGEMIPVAPLPTLAIQARAVCKVDTLLAHLAD